MTYRLKDQAFHAELDRLSDGDFSRALNASCCVRQKREQFQVCFGRRMDYSRRRYMVCLNYSEIEEVDDAEDRR